MPSRISLEFEGIEELQRDVEQTAGLLESRTIKEQAVRQGANILAKAIRKLTPKPGYPGDKPGLRPLNQTIRTRILAYPSGFLGAVVGPSWPAGGPHAHNVEFGHEMVAPHTRASHGRTRPVLFVEQAYAATREQVADSIEGFYVKLVERNLIR